MKKYTTFTFPTHWHEVTWKQYRQLVELGEGSTVFDNLAVLTGLDKEGLKNLRADEFVVLEMDLAQLMANAPSADQVVKDSISLRLGNDLHVLKGIKGLTAGQYEDMRATVAGLKSTELIAKLGRVVAIACATKDRIYDGELVAAKEALIEQMPCPDVLGAGFFYVTTFTRSNNGTGITVRILTYLVRKLRQASEILGRSLARLRASLG